MLPGISSQIMNLNTVALPKLRSRLSLYKNFTKEWIETYVGWTNRLSKNAVPIDSKPDIE